MSKQKEVKMLTTFSEDKQVEDLLYIIKVYGICVGKSIVISLWEMAFNINNTWRAEHFISKKRAGKIKEHGKDWAMEDFNLGKLFELIVKALMWTNKISLKRGENDVDYLICKGSLLENGG